MAGTGVWLTGEYRLKLDNSNTQGIKDIANNPLQANQQIGTVEFTIQLGGGTDFGDAPEPPFETLLPTGASHTITEGYFLGFGVDADGDGEPSADADRDALDDGVTFDTVLLVGDTAQVTVRASGDGFLDAWIGGAQIFASEPLVEGLNPLTFTVPTGIGSTGGESFARFRFSSVGGLGPAGSAPDGEVEDYKVQIASPTWQNSDNPFDVNANGIVSSQDILLLSHFLFFHGQQAVPDGPGIPPFPVTPPPFYDVNGDDAVTIADGLLLATYLRTALQIEVVNGQLTEGDLGATSPTSFTFVVTRSGELGRTTTVDYTVTGVGANSANAADFVGGTLPTGSITFEPLETSETVTVEIFGDTIDEPGEGFAVTLVNPQIAQITTPSALAIIVNDDAQADGDGAVVESQRDQLIATVITESLVDDFSDFIDGGAPPRSHQQESESVDVVFANLDKKDLS